MCWEETLLPGIRNASSSFSCSTALSCWTSHTARVKTAPGEKKVWGTQKSGNLPLFCLQMLIYLIQFSKHTMHNYGRFDFMLFDIWPLYTSAENYCHEKTFKNLVSIDWYINYPLNIFLNGNIKRFVAVLNVEIIT